MRLMDNRTLHRFTASLVRPLILVLPVALFVACQQGDADSSGGQERQVPLRLTSGISTSVTRAYDATWEDGNEIGVFTVAAGSTEASAITNSGTYQDANIAYKIATGGNTKTGENYTYMAFSPSDAAKTIYLPFDGSKVDVYAYYPYDDGASAAGKNITLQNSQTLAGQNGQKTYDLLAATAKNIDIDNPSAQLLFQHCLTKVLIVIKAGTGYAASDIDGHTAVKLTGTPTSATYLPLTQTLNIGSGTADIIPYQLQTGDPDLSKKGDGVLIYRALVMPNAAADGSIITVSGNAANTVTRLIKLTIGTGTTAEYTYTIDPTLYPFIAGQELKFTLTLHPTDVKITAAITPWDEHSTIPDAPLYEQ